MTKRLTFAVAGATLGFVVAMLASLVLPVTHTETLTFPALPPNDAALIGWARSQPGIREFRVTRAGSSIILRYRARPANAGLLGYHVPWSQLGYGSWTRLTGGRIQFGPSYGALLGCIGAGGLLGYLLAWWKVRED